VFVLAVAIAFTTPLYIMTFSNIAFGKTTFGTMRFSTTALA